MHVPVCRAQYTHTHTHTHTRKHTHTQALVKLLEEHKVVGSWKGRMGILGTRSGHNGFLDRKVAGVRTQEYI